MKGLKRFAASAFVAAAALTGMAFVGAVPANVAVCGFQGIATSSLGGGEDGKYEKATYANCSGANEEIRVHYFYVEETMCVTEGETILYANPHLGALTGAERVGAC